MRIPYFDFLRGVAIIMVVFIHCLTLCYTPLNIPLPAIIARNLMNIAVPIFFAISGYFLASKQMDNGGYASFLKKQIPRVYIPVLFCSLYFLSNDISDGRIVIPIIQFVICGYSIYYFIAVIIQCYLLLWILKKYVSKMTVIMLAIVGCLWWAVVNYLFGLYMGKSLPLALYAGTFFPWGAFFMLGLYYGSMDKSRKTEKQGVVVGLSLVFLFLSVVESGFFIDSTSSLNGLGQKSSAFCMDFLVCILVLRKRTRDWFSQFEKACLFRFLCVLGRYSFGIYLIHLFILSIVKRFHFSYLHPSVKWIIVSSISILASFLLLWLCKKILPKTTRILLGV